MLSTPLVPALLTHQNGSLTSFPRQRQSRTFEMLYMEPSDIGYCDATSSTPACKVAVDSVVYPNGLDLAPNGLLYSSSSAEPKMSVWEIQSGDNSLVLADTIEVIFFPFSYSSYL